MNIKIKCIFLPPQKWLRCNLWLCVTFLRFFSSVDPVRLSWKSVKNAGTTPIVAQVCIFWICDLCTHAVTRRLFTSIQSHACVLSVVHAFPRSLCAAARVIATPTSHQSLFVRRLMTRKQCTPEFLPIWRRTWICHFRFNFPFYTHTRVDWGPRLNQVLISIGLFLFLWWDF